MDDGGGMDDGDDVDGIDTEMIAEAILAGPDAIVAADQDGVIVFWNSGAERIFGHTSSEAIGLSLDVIIPQRQRERHWDGWRRVMRTGQSRYGAGDTLSVPALHRDGHVLSVEFVIHPISVSGILVGMAATLRDVSPRFQEMRELRQQLEAAHNVIPVR